MMVQRKWGIFIGLIFVFNSWAMDAPLIASSKKNVVYLTTSDGINSNIERWKIDEIKTLLVLLEQQKGTNSRKKPLIVNMLNLKELHLLNGALQAIIEEKFDQFCDAILEAEGTKLLSLQEQQALQASGVDLRSLQKKASLRAGVLRELINLAGRMNASIVSSFCLQYTMPSDIQRNEFVFDLVNNIIPLIPCPQQILHGHPNDVEHIAFSPDGTKFVTGCSSIQNNLILWDISTGKAEKLTTLIGHPSYVTAVAFSPKGDTIVSSCLGGQNNLMLWDVEKVGKQNGVSLVGQPDSINAVAFSPDGKYIASGSKGQQDNLIIWDVEAKKPLKQLKGHPEGVLSVLFSPDGTQLLSTGYFEDNNVLLWDIATEKNILLGSANGVGHPDTVFRASFSGDGKKAITFGLGNRNNKLILWDTLTGKGIPLDMGNDSSVESVAFNPNNKDILIASWRPLDNLLLWDMEAMKKLYSFSGYSRGIRKALFNKDGSAIISCGQNDKEGNVILYDIQTGRAHTLLSHPQSVSNVAISPDGRTVVACCTGNQNNLILVTPLSPEEEEALKKCTFIQAYFLYRLFLIASHGLEIDLKSTVEKKIYDSLPKIIKDMIYERILKESTHHKKNMLDWIPRPSFTKKKK